MIERNHETLLPDTAPTPEQLFRLASIGVSTAMKSRRLRHMQHTPKAHFFFDEIHLLNDIRHDGDPREIRHRIAGRIGRRACNEVPLREWSLKFYDTYWVEQGNGGWAAERTRYRFEWDQQRATLAEREIRVIGSEESGRDVTIEGALENFSMAENEADLWHVRSEVESVTADDCEQIIRDAAAYYDFVNYFRGRAA